MRPIRDQIGCSTETRYAEVRPSSCPRRSRWRNLLVVGAYACRVGAEFSGQGDDVCVGGSIRAAGWIPDRWFESVAG